MEVRNLTELKQAIELFNTEAELSVWLSLSDVKYPYMNILTKDGSAYLHYFEKEDHPGYQSIGESDEDEMTHINEANDIFVPIETLVSVSDAAKAGEEFYRTRSLPTAINWFEL